MNAYARATMDPTQDAPPPSETGVSPAPDDDRLAVEAEAARAERQRAADEVGGAIRNGLVRWTLLVVGGSFAALGLNHPDAALFLAVAAMFALAQSWDVRDRARTGDPLSDMALEPGAIGTVLRAAIPLMMPLGGAAVFAGLASFARSLPHSLVHVAAFQWCVASAVVCVAAGFPPFAQLLARAFMRGPNPGHTDRLTAALALVLLLVPVPFQLLSDDLMGIVKGSGRPIADVGSLVAQLLGEVVFALSAVGLWVGRDLRAVRARLGLDGVSLRQWGIAALGLVAVSGLNAGMDWFERAHYHALWLHDQDMTKLIAGNLGVGAALVLGVSAGVGEEVMVRGALQPRVGLMWASLLFAAGHVQYSWFGMLTIVLLGVTLGVVRKTANTTAAIVVHVVYDVLAVLGTR
jgi:membrane protease YdiL (CAAX protease family)